MNFLAVTAALSVVVSPPAQAVRHNLPLLPTGHHGGRCRLVEKGRRRISGPCIYEIYSRGEFHIDGPRQVFDGIDYPRAEITAQERSTDYWANVFRDEELGWTGYGNVDVRAVHGDLQFGRLRRQGA